MAVFESDHHAFEGKAQLKQQDQMDLDVNAQEIPLQNGIAPKESGMATSANDTAHSSNLAAHTDARDFEPSLANGVGRHDGQISDTQSSVGLSSSFLDPSEIDGHLLPSSQSAAPDDQDTLKVASAPIDTIPTVLQQPTSDVRDENLPVPTEQSATYEDGIQPINANSASKADDEQELDSRKPVSDIAGAGSESHKEGMLSTLAQSTETEPPSFPVAADAPHTEGLPTISTLTDEPSSIPVTNIPGHPPIPTPEDATMEVPVDPAPSPLLESNGPAQTLPTEPIDVASIAEAPSGDQIMQDAPSSAKIARGREEDETEDEPALKRSRVEEDGKIDEGTTASEFKIPERPMINTQVNGIQADENQVSRSPMTVIQYKALARAVQNVKRVQASTAFRQPVDIVALNIPNYPTIITKPMDLKTLEENLKARKYATVDAFVADFNQIVENSRIFNGPEHGVTKAALLMKASFEKQMENVPGPDVTEPAQGDKKKAAIPPNAKTVPARRESRSSLPGAARSPVSASSPQTFALGPQGVPLIRRDSTLLGDGRPKREIHPPAPRDLPYANQKPKKKKYQVELKFCDKALNEITKPRYASLSYPFMTPVDPVALNIPTYHSIIKKPMDFGTIRTKLEHGEYENAKEFEADVRLVFSNCYKFNPPQDPINRAGHDFEGLFDTEWAKKSDYLEANSPGSGAQSGGSSEDDDSDEEEDDDEDDQSELTTLRRQLATISKQMELIESKKVAPQASAKKTAKASKPARRDSKKSAAPLKPEKKAPSKPAKREKPPYVTYEQKQDISNRINSLSESKMATALKIIRDNMPNLKGVQSDELELDIDELSDDVLHKLLVFVRKHVPRPDDSPARPAVTTSSAAPARKKNKPMSKTEQELRIAQVQSGLSAFQNPRSAPTYDDPAPAQDSSEGEESSESEEE